MHTLNHHKSCKYGLLEKIELFFMMLSSIGFKNKSTDAVLGREAVDESLRQVP